MNILRTSHSPASKTRRCWVCQGTIREGAPCAEQSHDDPSRGGPFYAHPPCLGAFGIFQQEIPQAAQARGADLLEPVLTGLGCHEFSQGWQRLAPLPLEQRAWLLAKYGDRASLSCTLDCLAYLTAQGFACKSVERLFSAWSCTQDGITVEVEFQRDAIAVTATAGGIEVSAARYSDTYFCSDEVIPEDATHSLCAWLRQADVMAAASRIVRALDGFVREAAEPPLCPRDTPHTPKET